MFKYNFKALLICTDTFAKLRESTVCSLFYLYFILNLKFTDIVRRFYFVYCIHLLKILYNFSVKLF